MEVTIDDKRNFGIVKIADYVSHKELKAFLSSAFARIKRANVDNIIIDIRDLAVDDAGLPDAVLHYVTDVPYRHYAAIEAKASPITKEFYKGDFKQIMKAQKKVVRDKKAVKQAHKMVLKGMDYANTFYSPDVKKPAGGGTSLKGEFYLLVNEGTKNSGVVLAAIVQDHKQGLVIGGETGSRASRFNDYYYFSLPNTGLQCMVPHRYYLRPSSFDSGFGVLPDYSVGQNADDLANGIDTAIEFASDLFQKRKGYREKQRAYEKRMKKRN